MDQKTYTKYILFFSATITYSIFITVKNFITSSSVCYIAVIIIIFHYLFISLLLCSDHYYISSVPELGFGTNLITFHIAKLR